MNVLKNNQNEKGFTLIELLVVIGIIAVLTGISIFAMRGAQESGRDAKRKADLEVIRSGLELFKADCNVYPSCNFTTFSQLSGTGACGCAPANPNVYIQSVPKDPSGGNYIYRRITTTTYELCATLEQPPTPPSSCLGGGNYKVISP